MATSSTVVEQLISEKTTLCILGQKGTGKTYTAIYLSNLIKDKPVFVFDTTATISKSRLSKIKNIVVINNNNLWDSRKLFNLFNKMHSLGGCIFQLSSLVPRELVKFSDIFCDWALRRGNMAIFVDEVADYCPQSQRYYSVELERTWRDGRNHGIKPVVLITQRSQAVHKDLLALSDAYIIFRLFHNLDRAKVKDLLGLSDNDGWGELEKKIMTLKTREALAFFFEQEAKKLMLTFVEIPELKSR